MVAMTAVAVATLNDPLLLFPVNSKTEGTQVLFLSRPFLFHTIHPLGLLLISRFSLERTRPLAAESESLSLLVIPPCYQMEITMGTSNL